MKPSWQNILESLSQPEYADAIVGICRGIERESLRVTDDSRLASTDHPSSLGPSLTHSFITTDFAESLMEFITPAERDAVKTLETMRDIHRHVYRNLEEDQLLWPVSMPCRIESEDEIKLAHYGNSNVGKMKTVYRQGLKNRYGAKMQAIAGIHYNFSMPESFWPVLKELSGNTQTLQNFISDSYFGLIRNFFRTSWLIPYLFGASPAVDSSFLANTKNSVPTKLLGARTRYLPKGTSLRMSNLGYNTEEQGNLPISYNSLEKFVVGLRRATRQSNLRFKKIGVKRKGQYEQLNICTLQEESELYAPIRPKRVVIENEKLSDALEKRGVQYVEVRSLDVNPYSETGIDYEQAYFLDVFLTYCLLKDSPKLSQKALKIAKKNQEKVAIGGRDLSLKLYDGNNLRELGEWGSEILTEMLAVAQLLDSVTGTDNFTSSLKPQQRKIENPQLTPSARMLREIKESNLEITDFALNLAKQHRSTLLAEEYTQLQSSDFAVEVEKSRKNKRRIEESDNLTFDVFLQKRYGCEALSSSVKKFKSKPAGSRSCSGVSRLPSKCCCL